VIDLDARIEALVNRLAELPELEKELRREANGIVFPRRDASGTVNLEIVDEARYQAINEELESIAREKEATQDKVNRLAEVLGPSLVIPNPDRQDDYAARIRSEFLSRFENKICKSHRQPLTPEEGIASPEYATLKGEYMPRLDEIAAMQERDGKLAEAAYQILSGP